MAPGYLHAMNSEKSATSQQQILVMWVLWGAFSFGVAVMYQFLHAKNPPAPDGTQVWMVALAPVAASMFIRWSLLPRVTALQQALVLMILGVALAESALFFGMFVFSAHQMELFLAALFGIAQHAPTYAGKLAGPHE